MFKNRFATGVVVRRSYRGTIVRSKRRRGAAAETILSKKGSAVCVYELQGSLFFSTMEQVLRQVTHELDSFTYLIFDFKRVLQLDECAGELLAQTNELLKRGGKTLLLAHLAEHGADLCVTSGQNGLFADIDSALEWCEDRLLHEEQPELLRENRQIPLAAMDILAGFDRRETALIESIAEEMRYLPGAFIIREGDRADSLYLLAAGRVSICLRIKQSARRQRLSTITPGLAFGELALLDGGTRSADVIADEPTLCYVLPIGKLQTLAASHPKVHSKLIANIGRELSARLRRADAEIRSLAE